MSEAAEQDTRPAPDAFRTGRAYTVTQAAKLAGTTPATVRRWLVGYEAPGHRMAPVLSYSRVVQDGGPLLVSFLDLIELRVVAKFRSAPSGKGRVSLDRLRRAHGYARIELDLPYPFATLNIFEFGGHVLHDFQEHEPGPGVLALDVGGQWSLPEIVRQEETLLDFETGDPFPVRWFPLGRELPIVVDPHIGGGRPTIYRRGVTLATITERWHHGESMMAIAEDYELEFPVVEAALRAAA